VTIRLAITYSPPPLGELTGARKFMCVSNIMISKLRIINSRLLDPNKENQALTLLVIT